MAFLEPSQISKMELFVKIVNSIKPLTIFTKVLILDIRLGSKYNSVFGKYMGKKSIFFEYSIVTSSLYIENLIQKHLFSLLI